MIIKGHNRDTAWFAMLDGDWPRIKANMERWLYEEDVPSRSLTELNRSTAPPPLGVDPDRAQSERQVKAASP